MVNSQVGSTVAKHDVIIMTQGSGLYLRRGTYFQNSIEGTSKYSEWTGLVSGVSTWYSVIYPAFRNHVLWAKKRKFDELILKRELRFSGLLRSE